MLWTFPRPFVLTFGLTVTPQVGSSTFPPGNKKTWDAFLYSGPAPPPSSSDRSRLQDTGLSCASFGCTVVETKCIRCLVWRNSQRAEGEDDGTFCLIWEKTVWNQMSDSETVLRRRILLVWASTDCPLTCIFWSEELYIQKPEPMSWFKSEE